MKVLIAEKWPFHEECMPAYVYALNFLNITPEIMYSEISLKNKGNVFDIYPDLKYKITINWLDEKEKQIAEKISDSKYDLIIANSFQKDTPNFYLNFESTVLGITHHFPFLHQDTIEKINYLNKKSKKPKVHLGFLWDFIPRYFLNLNPDYLCDSVHTFYPLANLKFPETKMNRFVKAVIPGGINMHNRAYEMLMKGIKESKIEKEKIKFLVPGAGTKENIKKFTLLAKNYDLLEYFDIFYENNSKEKQKMMGYRQYYKEISNSDIILPLIKKDSRYRDYSISSAISVAYNSETLVGLNSSDSHLYHFPYSLIENFNYSKFLINLVEQDFLEKKDDYITKQKTVMEKLLSENVKSMIRLLDYAS